MSLSQTTLDDAVIDDSSTSGPGRPVTPETDAETTAAPPGEPAEVKEGAPREPQLERILGLPVPLTVVLAERDMPVKSILEIAVGTIIEFDVPFDSELTLQVADRTIGYGQAVKVGESFGLRLASIETVRDRINALGGS